MHNHFLEVLSDEDVEVTRILVDTFTENITDLSVAKRILRFSLKLNNAIFKIIDIIIKGRDYEHDRSMDFNEVIASHELKEISFGLNLIRLSKYRFGLEEQQLKELKESCDVIVLLGIGRILDGEFLSSFRYGVLSFHPADIRKYRGRPSGFHEWNNSERTLGITIQRLTKEIDGGRIVIQRSVSLESSLSLVSAMEQLRITRKGMMLEAINKVFNDDSVLEYAGILNHNKESDFYTISNVFFFIKKHIVRLLNFVVKSISLKLFFIKK